MRMQISTLYDNISDLKHLSDSVPLSPWCTGLLCRLRVFDSGVMVVQLQSHSEEEMIASALDNVSFSIM